MTFELAKELKDAGFPQRPYLGDFFLSSDEGSHLVDTHIEEWNEMAKAPSLSELIEACGDRFSWVRRNIDGTFTADSDYLKAEELGKYSTPEEALSRLWLALNSKS